MNDAQETVQPKKPRRSIRERYKRIAKSKEFKDAYEGKSVGEIIAIENAETDSIRKKSTRKPESKKTKYQKPRPRKWNTVTRKEPLPLPKSVPSLDFNSLYGSITDNVVGGVRVMEISGDIGYLERLTSRHDIGVPEAREIADRIRLISDAIEKQVHDMEVADGASRERQMADKVLKDLPGSLLVGTMSGQPSCLVTSVHRDGDTVSIVGIWLRAFGRPSVLGKDCKIEHGCTMNVAGKRIGIGDVFSRDGQSVSFPFGSFKIDHNPNWSDAVKNELSWMLKSIHQAGFSEEFPKSLEPSKPSFQVRKFNRKDRTCRRQMSTTSTEP